MEITIVNSTHSSEELIDYDVELKLSQPNEITIIEEIKKLSMFQKLKTG